jgi:hypothetical protein
MVIKFLEMAGQGDAKKWILNLSLTVFVMTSVGLLLLQAASRWIAVLSGLIPARQPVE